MTKLADAIRRSQRIEAAPMGFGAARPATRPTIVAGGLAAASESLQAYKDAGADVVVIDARTTPLSEADAKKLAADGQGLVLGVLGDAANATALREAGFDFIIFSPDSTAAAALLDEDLGYVLALPEQPGELFLRSLESLSLDAVYLESIPSPLTVARQLELNLLGLLGRKPLMALVPAGISGDDLRCLRAAGAGVVLAAGADAVRALKEAVAALPPRKSRKEEARTVSLPRGAVPTDDDEEDDE